MLVHNNLGSWINLYISLLVFMCRSVSTDDENPCYKVVKTRELILMREYQYCRIECKITVKQKCRIGMLETLWWKGNSVLLNETVKAKRTIRMELRFENLLMENSGDYKCIIRNGRFNFSSNVSLAVNEEFPGTKVISENTVPGADKEILKDKIYWMPSMKERDRNPKINLNNMATLLCQVYTLQNVNLEAVWYASRTPPGGSRCQPYGEVVLPNSPYQITQNPYQCDMDEWLSTNTGFCNSIELIIGSVTMETHKHFTCVINGQLKTTHHVVVEYSPYAPTEIDHLFMDRNSSDYLHNLERKLIFNESTSVCTGSSVTLTCIKTHSGGILQLLHDNGICESEIKYSADLITVSMEIKMGGTYICRWSNFMEKRMFLTVQTCPRNWPVNALICLTGVISVISLILVIYCSIYRPNERCRKSRGSEQVGLIHGLIIDDLIPNPNYLSLELDSQMEIHRNRVTVSTLKLGEGSFGVVYRGKFDDKDVAIKIALDGGHDMLVGEIKMMQQLGHHRHVLELLGVCVSGGPLSMIMELAPGGSLKKHLQENNILFYSNCLEITVDQLFLYALQISQGMDYLASKSVVHRDLATRNILLAENGDIKIADFGLSRIVINYYHSMSEDSRPIRWMAPECFTENRFTTKSDIWSFGIVLWEIFTLGVYPYFLLTFTQVREAICSGIINDKPELAPGWLYELMKRCWNMDEDLRPTFQDIITHLETSYHNEYV